jgi:hypothetical protein
MSALLIAIAWSLVVAFGGGLACAWCIDRYGELGTPTLWACGAFAGYISRKITCRPDKAAGLCQAVAACVAFIIADTWWIHWNIVGAEESWWVALSFWRSFIHDYERSVLIGAVFAGCGAWWAYGYATSQEPRPSQPAATVAPPP